jgi:hypothetical protein
MPAMNLSAILPGVSAIDRICSSGCHPTKTHFGRVGTSPSTADAEPVPLKARPASLASAEHVEKPHAEALKAAADDTWMGAVSAGKLTVHTFL